MSNYDAYGTVSTATTTDESSCRGTVTLSAHLTSGSGTLTWQFKGIDGTWRSIYGGADGTTAQAFTASHMVNVLFGGDVRVRGSSSGGTWDWQVIGNYRRDA